MRGREKIMLISFSFFIVLFITLFYQLKPDYLLIYQHLESLAIFKYKVLLDGSAVSLITNSLGKEMFAFPAIFFTLFITILKYPSKSLVLFNGLLLAVGSVFFALAFDKGKSLATKLLFVILFLLTPVSIDLWRLSLELTLAFLFFGMYLYFKNKPIRYLLLFLIFITSYFAIPLVIFTLIIESNFKKKKVLAINFLIVISILVFTTFHSKTIFTDYFSVFKPATHGFYIDIHKQAEKVLGIQLLGKLFYNKYLVISRSVVDRAASFVDWDFWVFTNVSGKFDLASGKQAFPVVTVFELPFILYGFYLGLKSSRKILFYFFAAVLCMGISNTYYFYLPIYVASLVSLFITGLFNKRKYFIGEHFLFLILLVIFISRLAMIQQADYDIKKVNSRYYIYEQIAEYLKGENKSLYLTDRMGLPQIYLTFFNVDDLKDLIDVQSSAKSRDAQGFKKPSSLGKVVFTSLNNSTFDNIDSKTLANSEFIELQEYVPNILNKKLRIFDSRFYYKKGDGLVETKVILARHEQ